MNKKLLSIAALVVIFAFGFLYLNQSLLVANDKDGKDCKTECTQKVSDKTGDKTGCDKTAGEKSSCSDKKGMIKAGGEYSSYQFTTDKACCDGMKVDLQKNLLEVAGVKEVTFSSTCNVSKMTNVTVMYAAGETSEDNLASFLKDKSYDCSGKSCDKDGMKSGSIEKDGCNKDGIKSGDTKKDGCDTKKECPSKNKKSEDSKQL